MNYKQKDTFLKVVGNLMKFLKKYSHFSINWLKINFHKIPKNFMEF